MRAPNRTLERMERAKALFTRAAKATLEGLPLAPQMAAAALAELSAAQAQMNKEAEQKMASNVNHWPLNNNACADRAEGDARQVTATFNSPQGER
jgi:hypothetical protein